MSWISKIKWRTKDWMEGMFNDLNNQIRKRAGIDKCTNVLDLSLDNCNKCISATAAGKLSGDDMRDRYGWPHRHPKCGCFLLWDKDTTINDIQIAQLTEIHGDLDEIENKYQESERRREQREKRDEFAKEMKTLMEQAHAIAKTLEGDYQARMSEAMREAHAMKNK